MPASYQVNLTDTPLRILELPTGVPQSTVYITNNSSTEDVFIGDTNVSVDNGFLITKQQASGVSYRIEFELFAGGQLWACCRPTKTGSVHVGYSA